MTVIETNTFVERFGWANGAVASAAALHAVGRGFESLFAHHLFLEKIRIFWISDQIQTILAHAGEAIGLFKAQGTPHRPEAAHLQRWVC